MAYRNDGFLEGWKIAEKWSQPWQMNLAFSGAESLRGAFPASEGLPFLRMPRRQQE
jgi:hypothetical protein